MMDYLWRNYSPSTQYELNSSMSQSGPSIEVSFRSDNKVVINPLPRFRNIFGAVLKRRDLWAAEEEKIQLLANCLFHILVQIDRISGISSALIIEDDIENSLLNGRYGERIRTNFENLSRDRKKIVLNYLRKQDNYKGSRLYFREAVKSIFPQSGIYFYKPDLNFLIYLPQRENDADSECISLLADLFLDVTAKWQVYWHYPFGIIEKKKTMRINNMRLYSAGKDL